MIVLLLQIIVMLTIKRAIYFNLYFVYSVSIFSDKFLVCLFYNFSNYSLVLYNILMVTLTNLHINLLKISCERIIILNKQILFIEVNFVQCN